MATNPDRIVVPGLARIYVAPVGTAAPLELADPAAAWVDVGLTTEDGTTFSTDPSFERVMSHQSAYPTRTYKTTDAAQLAVEMQEWSDDNFVTAFGGGTIVETGVGSGIYRYEPPAPGTVNYRAVLVDAFDGDKRYRIHVPKALAVEGVELNLGRTANSNLPVTLEVQGGDAAAPWSMVTNDPAFAPAA